MLTSLKILRMTKYPKAKTFAQKAGINAAYFSRIERGEIRKPNLKTKKKIAELLGVDEKSIFQS